MPNDRFLSSDDPWATDEPIDSDSIEDGLAKKISDRVFHITKKILDIIDLWAKISISSFKIISILVLIILAGAISSWTFFGGGGLTILPFETFGLEENQSGTSIAQLLNCELQNIKETDAIASTIEIPSDITSGIPIENRPLSHSGDNSQFPNHNQYGDFSSLVLESGSINIPLTNMGTVGMGDTSLSIGNLLLFMRDLFRNSPSKITGSLQKYGSTIILVATLEDHTNGKIKSWEVRKNLNGNSSSINDQIPLMVKGLAFRIALYFGDKEEVPRNWSALDYLIGGENAYINYNITGNPDYLEEAKNRSLLAIKSEHNYRKPLDFLSNLAFFFIKENRSNDAEKIFLYIAPFDPIKCNIGLGVAYSEEGNYTEAVMAYDKAILLDPKNTFALNSRGIALTALHNYAGAIQDYNDAIKLDPTIVIRTSFYNSYFLI